MEKELPKEGVWVPATPAKSASAGPKLVSVEKELKNHLGGNFVAGDFNSLLTSIDRNRDSNNMVLELDSMKETGNGFDSGLCSIDLNSDMYDLDFGESRKGYTTSNASVSSQGVFGGFCASSHCTRESSQGIRRISSSENVILGGGVEDRMTGYYFDVIDQNCLESQISVFGNHGNNTNNQIPQYDRLNHEDKNEGKKVHYDENSQPNVGLASNVTPSRSENRRRKRIVLNKEPRERLKKKRYWPKIAIEGIKKAPTKMPKLSTPAPRTPKKSPHEKRKYVRKKNLQTSPSKSFDSSGDLHGKKTKYVMENNRKTSNSENVDPSEDVNENKVKSSFSEYIYHSENVEKSDGTVKSCKRALNFEWENTGASTQIVGFDQKSPVINKTVCRFNSLYVYGRVFRQNDCPRNSRKFGPNFPRMCKKRRRVRQKVTMWGVLCPIIASQEGQRWVNKKIRGKRSRPCMTNNRMARAKRSTTDGVIYMHMQNSFRRMISRKKAQTGKENGDSEWSRSALSSWFIVNGKRERSKGLRRRRTFPSSNLSHFSLTVSLPVNADREGFDKTGPKASIVPLAERGVTKGENSMLVAIMGRAVSRAVAQNVLLSTSRRQAILPQELPYQNGFKASIVQLNEGEVTEGGRNMLFTLGSALSFPNQFEGYPTQNRDILTMSKICNAGFEDKFLKELDAIVKGLEGLHIGDEVGQLVVQDQKANVGTLVVFKKRKPPPPALIDFDSETIRVWNRIMGNDGSADVEEEDEERKKLWEEQREVFRGRVSSFIARMHIIQGNRRFSKWKGSVIDSVVGVFLTQNVADVLSSSAYMSLASEFPLQPTDNHNESVEVEEIPVSQESVGSNTEERGEVCDANGELSLSQETEQEMTQQLEENSKETVVIKTCFSSKKVDSMAPFRDLRNTETKDLGDKSLGCVELVENETEILLEATPKSQESKVIDPNMSLGKCQVPLKSNSQAEKNENVSRTEKSSRSKGNKVEKKQEENIDWDILRKTYSNGSSGRENNSDTMDSLDWEAVRNAKLDKVANCIRGRGQYNIIGQRIQEFLDRVVRDHGSLDLEWLRDVPPEKTKEYLLSINGLGLKSVECIRLLALEHHAFPVDTNVNRIAVRLGWVPLQPLPGDIHLHLLETYPVMDAVQKYLWPRLCTLDQRTLYELHYQMITFGKVFCTKGKPNCGPCPMRGECRHYASAVASARLALPVPPDRRMVSSKDSPISSFQNLDAHITQTALSLLKANLSDQYQSKSCEPIIEYPASPEPECSEPQLPDIEDYYSESKNEIPTLRLNAEELKENLLDYLRKINMPSPEDDMSKALVLLTSEAASKPAPKLKSVSRLRTVHQVYELPDTHPLVETLDKREPDDSCPYLLAIWIEDEATNSGGPQRNSQESELCNECNNFQQEDSLTVRGTILIPCRTAMRRRFPLNGTYFQVNEVFADNESMKNPINVPRAWIWHLHRRHLYCATQVTSIFKGLSTEEVQYCFWRGFVCVRAFDRKTRAPVRLDRKFHVTVTSTGKRKESK